MNLLVDTIARKMKLIMRKYLTHTLKLNFKVWIKWRDKIDLKGQEKSNESKVTNFCGGKLRKVFIYPQEAEYFLNHGVPVMNYNQTLRNR